MRRSTHNEFVDVRRGGSARNDDILVVELDTPAGPVSAYRPSGNDGAADAVAIDDIEQSVLGVDQKMLARNVVGRREWILEEIHVVDLTDSPSSPLGVRRHSATRRSGLAPYPEWETIDGVRLAVDGTPRLLSDRDQPWSHSGVDCSIDVIADLMSLHTGSSAL